MKLLTNRKILFSCITLCFTYLQAIIAQDNLQYCNAVQNRVGLIRYPIGTIAVSSVSQGEIADAMSLVPRVYPCVGAVVDRGENNDWRASVTGDPSILKIRYKAEKPSGASTTEITVTPHVSAFKISFPEGAKDKYVVFDFTRHKMDQWAKLFKWTERTIERIDDRTFRASLNEPGKPGVFYTIVFSVPSVKYGVLDSTGTPREGQNRVSGIRLGMYARFDAPSVNVAISESFVSFGQSREFLASEYAGFDKAYRECNSEWKKALGQVEMEGTENNKRMAYTSLYSILVNVINGSEGCGYLKYYQRPVSIASSAYWQFIGGFQSCCWDNYRTAYPFLMLGYPEIMRDVVNTYLARYKRDGCVDGNICLFTGPTSNHTNIRFCPVLAEEALQSGIKADYAGLYKGLKDNFSSDQYFPATMTTLGYETQSPSGGKACSQTLEWSTGLHSLAMLAKANNDLAEMERDYRLSASYKNLWDSTALLFRVKNTDGSWGIINNKSMTWDPNPQGLFEGTNKDWMFSVPHDPYGLMNLPGQKNMVDSIIDYCENHTWFNDYQYHYPYLLYYADAANACQRIIRDKWVPMFKDGIIYEGVKPRPPHNGWNTHYTSNAGWLLCSMTGMYPVPSPAGQYIITSPSLAKTVIHNGNNLITVEALNNSEENIYISEIKVNGKAYPSYLIPASKLVSGVTISLVMSNDPESRPGNLYISSSDGFVESAGLIAGSRLKCTIKAPIIGAITKIYCADKPAGITINGKKQEAFDFDPATRLLTIHTKDKASIEVTLK